MVAKKAAPVRMAVVGLGRAGWGLHVQAIRGREDFVLTEVVDLDAARRAEAEREFGCKSFSDFRTFLRQATAELVVIASQSQEHAPMALAALAAGKHVLVEKPIATRFSDIDRMMAAAEKSGTLLTVHQSARLYGDLLHIQEVVRRGVLGKVFNVQRTACGFGRRNDWQTLRKYGGGQLNNTGVHFIDQVMQVLDSPATQVFGDLQQILNPGDVEDHVKVVFRTESGAVGEVQLAVCALPLPTWVVMGTRGSLVCDGKTSKLRYMKGKLSALKPMDSTAVPNRQYGIPGGDTIEFVEEEIPATASSPKNFYDYLYDSLRKGKPLLVTAQSVRRTMEVVKLARRGTKFA